MTFLEWITIGRKEVVVLLFPTKLNLNLKVVCVKKQSKFLTVLHQLMPKRREKFMQRQLSECGKNQRLCLFEKKTRKFYK